MAYLTKTNDQLLQQAIKKISSTTSITNLSPGSIARALVECISTELADFYSVLNFNLSTVTVSTATGTALDLIGALYNIPRKTLGSLAAVDASTGTFYFFLATPFPAQVIIPAGTLVSTTNSDDLGGAFTYQTTTDAVINIGRTRAYASLKPSTVSSVFAVGANSLTVNNFVGPPKVYCTNPKSISSQPALESDDAYRIRVVQAVRTNAGGTIDSIRFAGLGVSGVRDIVINNVPFGLGSVEAIVVTEDNTLSQVVVGNAALAMAQVRPAGVVLYISEPDILPTDVSASIIVRMGVNVVPGNVTQQVQVGIVQYLNSLTVAQPLVYNQLIQAIIDSSDVVADVVITNLAVNGEQILRKNFIPDSNQQIVPGLVSVS